MKFTIDLDNINNKYVVYKSGSFFVDIPYFVYGLPPVVLDEYLTVVKCSSSAFEMMYTAPDLTTVQLYQFDFIGVLNKIEPLLSFGFGIFEANYSDMLFWDSFTHANPYQFLDSTNFTFDAVTGLVTGLQYVDAPLVSTPCDLASLAPEFDEIDLSIATLDDKVVSLHQKVDYLVTLLGQTYNLSTTLVTKDDILTLATKTDILNIDLLSLNGNGSEFIDGVEVKVFGRDTVYTVERSFMSLYSDNGYTVHYDLTSVDGYKCTVPEALLTKHVVAV